MIKKVLIIIYGLIITFFAISSSLITWVNDSKSIFFIELIVDLIIISGVMLSLTSKRIKWWMFFLVFAIIGEIYLLTIDPRVGFKEAIQWSLILLPALYLNFKVTVIPKV